MRKTKRFIYVAIITVFVCMCFLFSGCSAKGEYKFEKLTYEANDSSITIEVGDKFEGVELQKDSIVLVLNDDNTFVIRMHSTTEYKGETTEETEVQVGTWTEGYKKELYLTVDDETIIFEKDGNRLIGEWDGVTVTLKK